MADVIYIVCGALAALCTLLLAVDIVIDPRRKAREAKTAEAEDGVRRRCADIVSDALRLGVKQ